MIYTDDYVSMPCLSSDRYDKILYYKGKPDWEVDWLDQLTTLKRYWWIHPTVFNNVCLYCEKIVKDERKLPTKFIIHDSGGLVSCYWITNKGEIAGKLDIAFNDYSGYYDGLTKSLSADGIITYEIKTDWLPYKYYAYREFDPED